MAEDEVRIEHPNRDKAVSKATRAVVILLLPVSAALVAITLLIVPVQLLLIAFAMRGFTQEWNVEVEPRADGTTHALPAAG